MIILLQQLWDELLPWERTPWSWSKHVKFRPSWIMTVPQRLCFSAQLSNCNVATCWHIELGILGLLHLSIAFIGEIVLAVLWSVNKGVPKQTCKNELWWKQGCKLIDQIYTTVLLHQLWDELLPWERTRAWSKHVKFRPSWIMTVPQRLHFSAQLSDCNLATCWHIDLSRLCLLQFQSAFISEKASVVVWSSFKKMTLGLALGEFCTTTEKHWCPVSIFAYFRGKAFLGKPA